VDRYELEAVVISRRALVTSGPLALAGCGTGGKDHFGRSRVPASQRLVYLNRSEPASLDSVFVTTSKEINITQCLFVGLTENDPLTLVPRAALATHYETTAAGRFMTFYLRGHRRPKGIRLPGSHESLTAMPARWSDGVAITAHDFVYSWRRLIDPKTATGSTYLLFYVSNAKDINARRNASLQDLGVEAVDDFTLRVEFQSPAPFFLNIVSTGPLAAPLHVIQEGESFWTRPGRIVVSGPFHLEEWRSYDRVVLRKNPMYFNAGKVRLDEVRVLHVQERRHECESVQGRRSRCDGGFPR
jgi:oligopeptide transport system substrate-binding protein